MFYGLSFCIAVLLLCFAIYVFISFIYRVSLVYSSSNESCQDWHLKLKPFEKILINAGCNVVEEIKSKHLFSLKDKYSNLEGMSSILNFSSNTCNIKIYLACDYADPFERMFGLGRATSHITSILFKFKTNNNLFCWINSNNDEIIFHADNDQGQFQFKSSQDMLQFVEDQLLLELFS